MKNKLVPIYHVRDAILDREKHTDGLSFDDFTHDVLVQDAVIRKFIIIGEAANNVAEDIKTAYKDVSWQDMKDFRNVLVHEYFRIELGAVWAAIKSRLPVLKEQVRKIIEDIEVNEGRR